MIIVLIAGCGGGGGNGGSGGGGNSNPDTIAPFITNNSPTNSATGVAVNSTLSATFSEGMDAQSVITSFSVVGMTGSVTYDGASSIAVFTPSGNLQAGTTYTAIITVGAKDSAGNAMATDYSWSFTTSASATSDTTAPMVSYTSPIKNATGIAVNSAITVNFSEAMDPATLTSSSFTIAGKSGTVSCDATARNATFKPSGDLTAGTTYTATITTGARDVAGNPLAAPYSWSFTTRTSTDPATPKDIVSPTVNSTTPADKATGVAVNSAITVTFSEAMDPATITTGTFVIAGGITGNVSYDAAAKTAVFKPSGDLAANTTYTANVTAGARDVAGNSLSTYSWSFTTRPSTDPEPPKDTVAPTVVSTYPVNNATGVAINTHNILVTFSEAMNPTTINTATFTLSGPSGIVTGTVTYNSAVKIATFEPSGDLAPNAAYTANVTAGTRDLAGNPLYNGSPYTWSFTTSAVEDTTSPTVVTLYPIDGATNIPVNAILSVTLNEPVAPFPTGTIYGKPVVVTFDATYKTVTISLMEGFKPNTSHTSIILVYDMAGNSQTFTWNFTTQP